MRLQDAIKLAARFTDKRKDAPEPLKAVRLLPSEGEKPSRLYATDGVTGVLCRVDQPLPNLLLPADMLTRAVHKTISVLRIEAAGFNKAVMHMSGADGDATYQVQGLPLSEFPGYPASPGVYYSFDARAVARVKHAVGKESHKPQYHVVSFRPDFVEAFDLYRMARAELPGQFSGLVPGRVFQNWPKCEEGLYAFTEHHAFFRFDDAGHVRFAPLQHIKTYPKLAEVFPDKHDGPWMVLDVKALRSAVERAGKMSPTAAVQFVFGPDFLDVRAWALPGNDCAIKVPGRPGVVAADTDCRVLLDAKLLDASLKAVATPRVKVCYRGDEQPVRLESAGFVECIMHMRSVQQGV